MIVLDASVLIAWLDASDAHHHDAVRLLEHQVSEGFATGPITRAEALVVPTRLDRGAEATARFARLELGDIPFGADAAERLAQLRVTTGLRLPDCCVLLAAQDGDGQISTFDDRLGRAAEALGLRRVR